MRGYPQFNFPMFDRARNFLIKQGCTPFSPADHDRACGLDEKKEDLTGFDLKKALAWDVHQVLYSDGILFLPNWTRSRGARLEMDVATFIGGKVFKLFIPGTPDRWKTLVI